MPPTKEQPVSGAKELVERLRKHFCKLPDGYFNDSDYGCNWDDPESLVMAFLDSGPRGTDLLQTLTAGGYSIVRTEVVDEAATLLERQAQAAGKLAAALKLLIDVADAPVEMPMGRMNPGDLARNGAMKFGIALLEQLPAIRSALTKYHEAYHGN
jgi:hypothetical protein